MEYGTEQAESKCRRCGHWQSSHINHAGQCRYNLQVRLPEDGERYQQCDCDHFVDMDLVETVAASTADLLTDIEKDLLDQIGLVMAGFRIVVHDGNRPSFAMAREIAEADLREVAGHIHALQDKVLAQAAARAYPDEFRLMGGVVGGVVGGGL